MTTCVIVDGNNLAHYLFDLGSGKPVPIEIDTLMVKALTAWASSQNRKVEVELCLDPRRVTVAGNQWVTVFAADPGKQADGMVVGKVGHRVYIGDPCIVITSDEELKSRVAEFQVRCIGVRDFVLSANPDAPIFAPLPQKVSKGFIPALHPSISEPPKLPQKQLRGLKRHRPEHHQGEYDQLMTKTLADRNFVLPNLDEYTESKTEAEREPLLAPTNPTVQLTFDTWPQQAGVKFLKESFCPIHFPAVSELFKESVPIKPGDISVLAEFLLEHCGMEDDFITRGGCLMDRVRLALLRAADLSLTFAEIAALTGDSLAEVKRKARHHDGRWVKIQQIQAT